MNKEIFICIDEDAFYVFNESIIRRETYATTEIAIKANQSPILTTSLAHLSFDLIDKGYDVYLCNKERRVKIEEGMRLSESGYCLSRPTCCEDADILDCFMTGYFDKLLGIKKGE